MISGTPGQAACRRAFRQTDFALQRTAVTMVYSVSTGLIAGEANGARRTTARVIFDHGHRQT